jgi:hypothetical protein
MSEHGEGTGFDEVGSIGEEAAKLLSALQDWAKDAGSEQASAAAQAANGAAEAVGGLGDHIGHGPDCRYCPICQVINVVRDTSPEVKKHLAVAAQSLLQAVQGMLATQAQDPSRPRRTAEPVQRIDLDDESDESWDDD